MPPPTSLKPVDANGWQVDPAIQPPPKPTTVRRHRQRSDEDQYGFPSIDDTSISQPALPIKPEDDQVLSPAAEDADGDMGLSLTGRKFEGDIEEGGNPAMQDQDVKTELPGRAPAPSVFISSSSPPSHTSPLYPPSTTSAHYKRQDGYFPTPPRSRSHSGSPLLMPSDVMSDAGQSDAASVDMEPSPMSGDASSMNGTLNGTVNGTLTGSAGSYFVPSMATMTLNGLPFEMPEGTDLNLNVLNVPLNYYLSANGTMVRLHLDGTPVERLRATPGLVLQTIAYPSLFPVNLLYWFTHRISPTRKQIAAALTSAWGVVFYNCAMAIITGALTRPLIHRAGSTTAELVVSVISGARILDTMLRDTIYKLLTTGQLTRRMVLFCLITSQLAAMIAGSISLRCLTLLEFRIIPSFVLFVEVVCPLLHAGWTQLGVLERNKNVSLGFAVGVGVVLPVLVVVVGGGVDIAMRVRGGWVDPFTCGGP
ncbi:hypothetical protein HDU97_010345 [Phlyctochytrium planicorne]|nr:hypothetical protein HDU97_010345 [Phlyctochytrium planicorne]